MFDIFLEWGERCTMILSEVGVLVRLFMSNRRTAYSKAVSNQCLDVEGRFFLSHSIPLIETSYLMFFTQEL